MSGKKSSTRDDKGGKRNLPSWMSSSSTTHHSKQPKISSSTDRDKPESSTVDTLSFSKLMEGVVFVLSGFVNPERSNLRSQAQEMGAEYQPDWNPNCTLLVCAFPNTPKFRQVEADFGTIASKEWISECYNNKKLVAIETYLMHVGKPWRRGSASLKPSHDDEITTSAKPQKQVEKSAPPKSGVSASSKVGAKSRIKECFSPTEVKKWAIDDLNETVSWLESQDESPEPTQVKEIAAEGILTCLQDAIDSLDKKEEISKAVEQWKFVPRVVKELAKFEELKSSDKSIRDKDIREQALTCKRIYEIEFNNMDDDPKSGTGDKDTRKADDGYDSDETVEMTEDEIDSAYTSISSKLGK